MVPILIMCIQISQKRDRKVMLTLNARNEHDRSKFVEDLKESIAEMDEMETLRLESELEKQRLSLSGQQMPVVITSNGGVPRAGATGGHDNTGYNRDSGITDNDSTSVDPSTSTTTSRLLDSSAAASASNGGSRVVLRKSAINNSLLDLSDMAEKMARRGSVGSLDSGMSISFQSSSQLATTVTVTTSRQSSTTSGGHQTTSSSAEQHSSQDCPFNSTTSSPSVVAGHNKNSNPPIKKRSFSGSGAGSRGASNR